MTSYRAWFIGSVCSWLLESIIFMGVYFIDVDRSYEGLLSEVILLPFIIAISMSPVLLSMTLAAFLIDPESRFWRFELSVPFGFVIGFINYLFIYSVHSGVPSPYERLLWVFIILSGISSAFGFGIISSNVRKIQT